MKTHFKRKVSFGCAKIYSVIVLICLVSFNATVKKICLLRVYFLFLAAYCTKQEKTDGFQCIPCALGSSGTSRGEILFISHILQVLVWRVFSALCIEEQMFLFQTHIEEQF